MTTQTVLVLFCMTYTTTGYGTWHLLSLLELIDDAGEAVTAADVVAGASFVIVFGGGDEQRGESFGVENACPSSELLGLDGDAGFDGEFVGVG